MRRSLWIAAAILVLVAVAPALWLVLDGGGERRAGALVEPTASGDIGKLTISALNGGAPILIRSFTTGVEQPRDSTTRAVHLEFRPLKILRPIDSVSPLVLSAALPGTAIAPSAKLELVSAGKPYMTTSSRVQLRRSGRTGSTRP